ncbi:hypothetical protein E7Z59_11945 [Robertkochia marina]|uniref:Ig-like domain-containing protein n=1 Tax=Robertkochia marina TaxID=1227945 RepID=A0A4S3M0H1_9FLAO|nr:Ig-like domain-containing protein [Robertkochia marina]THD66507.1 hypothetical protein E7Z59_11945 [Robertkochia marina]TRZ45654.1 hypothetical protein D3A96_06690 [Robertkochia marina]
MRTSFKTFLCLTSITVFLIFACSKDDDSQVAETPEEPVVVDTTPPTVSFSIGGTSGQNDSDGSQSETDTTTTVVGQQIEIVIEAEDAVGISRVEAYVNDTLAGSDNEPPFKITIDFNNYANKGKRLNKTQTEYNLKVSAYDLAENVSSVEQTVVVDTEIPIISEVSLENDALLTGANNQVTFIATDNEELALVEAFADDLPLDVIQDSTLYSFNLETSLLPDGIHSLLIAATDKVGLRAEYQMNFISDNIAPSVELTKLSSGSNPDSLSVVALPENPSDFPVVARYAALDVLAEDATGIREVSAYIENKLVATDTITPYELLLNLTNFNAKTDISQKSDTLYTLKIVSTDLVGLKDSISQQVYVDNIKPVISDLNLKNNQGLKGTVNAISFTATDNHLMGNAYAAIDGTALEVTKDSTGYQLNIDTSLISDGWHTLTITAKDEANNQAIKKVNFLSDNTPPEITVAGLTDNQILDTLFSAEVQAIDLTSLTDSISVSIANIILNSTTDDSLVLNFDPEGYQTGEQYIKITATDTLGNAVTDSIRTIIKRRLASIKVPFSFPDLFLDNRVFVSRESGELMDEAPLNPGEEVRLHAPGEFTQDEKFVLTFYRKETTNPNSQANLFSLFDLDRQNLVYVDLKTYPQTTPWESNRYALEGIENTDKIVTKSNTHSGVRSNNEFFISTSTYNDAQVPQTDFAYIYLHDQINNDYSISVLNKPLPVSDTIRKAEFSSTNVDRIPITFNNISKPFGIRLKGYTSEEAYQADQYHQLFYANVIMGNMPFLNGLHKYRTEVYTSTYYYVHESLPFSEYNEPGWGVDFTQAGNNVQLSLSGSGHNVGRGLFIQNQGDDIYYNWFVRFNSETRTSLTLPDLPESVSGTPFYTLFQNQQLILRELAITNYADLTGYNDYLHQIIRHNRNDHFKVSVSAESVFKVKNNEMPLLWTIERLPY